MTEFSIPAMTLLTANATALLLLARSLWQLDRRLLQIEVRLKIKDEEKP